MDATDRSRLHTVGHKGILETISQEVLNKYLSVVLSSVEATEATPIIGGTFRTIILKKKKSFVFFPVMVGYLNS